MALTRRQFLTTVGGGTLGAVIAAACGIPEDELFVQSPAGMPEDLVTGLDNWYATLSNGFPTSEGVVVRVMEGRAKKVEGNVDYPINQGRHSPRSEALLQDLYNPDRIKGPMARVGERGAGNWEEIGWSDAISRISHQLGQVSDARQNREVVVVTGPSVSHAGVVVDRFVDAYRGTHIGYEALEKTNLRTVMKNLFDQDRLPDFDIENTNYLLSFGADFLNTWVSPVRYMRAYGEFRQGDRPRGTLVHVDSRFSMTGANADENVFVKPGREGLLALSMIQVIVTGGLGDPVAARDITGAGNVDIDRWAPELVAEETGVAAEKIKRIAEAFATNRPALAIGGGSAGAHTNGLFNLTAIYSLNYLVGAVHSRGGLLFNPAPATADLANVEANLTVGSAGDWRDLIRAMTDGKVKALMIDGSDPMYGLPDAMGLRDASFNVPFIFSFASHLDDTTSMADLVLPTHTSLEEWGTDVPTAGPGHQVVGFQQPVVRPFFENRGEELGTRSMPDALMAIASELGLDLGLDAQNMKELVENAARQLFDLGRGSVTADDFRAFRAGVLQRGGWWDTTSEYDGPVPTTKELPAEAPEPKFAGPAGETFHLVPFSSTSMGEGQGAHLPWLQALPDPLTSATWATWVEINHKVAELMDIREGDVVRVVSAHGTGGLSGDGITAIAYPHPGVPTDVVSIPLGQGHKAGGRYAEGRGGNALSILAPRLDEESGALAWAATRVTIEKVGEWKRLPKFENNNPDFARDEAQKIIKITPIDS
jgi:anaerobic selenocysteine-containing dehydrogenase